MAHQPVTGFVYSDVKGPLMATSNSKGKKTGKATARSILGWIADGDASIAAAAKNGGITKIRTVDHKSKNILGFYAEYTTIVTGD
jgi:hypothetical protein